MALKLSTLNNVSIYNCTAGRSTPQFLQAHALKQLSGSLRYNAEYRSRIDLIQDFDFPQASTVMRLSPDKRYIAAAGTYGPQIKVFECSQLAMKFERHCDAHVVDLAFLSSDYRKLALMREDRTIELHAAYGKHACITMPHFGSFDVLRSLVVRFVVV